ncbi:MAG: hypothetical protein P8099_15270, partial [Gemmatimonadota bacterium]
MSGGASLDRILGALQERAKELRCLCRVEEILDGGGREEDVLRAVLAALPDGWQFDEVCVPWLRIGRQVFAPRGFAPTEWVLTEPVRVRFDAVGELRVYYTEDRPLSATGPFLEEERQLLRSVAERIGDYLAEGAPADAAEGDRRPRWRTVIDFLDRTDPHLSGWLARKMLNHLQWKGILDANDIDYPADEAELEGESNRPLPRLPEPGVPVAAVFDLAQAYCSEEETLYFLQSWVAQDRASFLTHVLERQSSSVREIARALERFHGLTVAESDLPRSLQTMLRVALLRRFFSNEIEFINAGKDLTTLHDFHVLSQRLLMCVDSHGGLGGKSAGLF